MKFVGYLTLDANKHEVNKSHLPLIETNIKCEDGSPCISCESIVVTESHDAYAWVVQSMYEM